MQKVVSAANAVVQCKHLIASVIKYKAFLASFQPFSSPYYSLDNFKTIHIAPTGLRNLPWLVLQNANQEM